MRIFNIKKDYKNSKRLYVNYKMIDDFVKFHEKEEPSFSKLKMFYNKFLDKVRHLYSALTNSFLLMLYSIENPYLNQFLKLKEVSSTVNIDPLKVIYLYDRSIEGSLFAAAVIKYLKLGKIVEYGAYNKISITTETQLCWLGFRPVKRVFDILKCQHIALTVNKPELGYGKNMHVIFGYYETITEQLFSLIENADLSELKQKLIGASFIIEGLSNERSKVPALSPNRIKEIKDINKAVLIKAYSLIKSAYEYIHYDIAFDFEKAMLTKEYEKNLSDIKYLLDISSNTTAGIIDGRIVTTYCIDIIDHRWYLMKRFISLTGQRWRLNRVIGNNVYCYHGG